MASAREAQGPPLPTVQGSVLVKLSPKAPQPSRDAGDDRILAAVPECKAYRPVRHAVSIMHDTYGKLLVKIPEGKAVVDLQVRAPAAAGTRILRRHR